jgi:TRAP-type transport system periplasmic protein
MARTSKQIANSDGASPRPTRPIGRPGSSRRRALGLLLATAGGGLLAACAPRAPESTSTSGPAAPPQAAPARPAGSAVELVLGHIVPVKHEYHTQLFDPWAAEVEQRSGGRMRITIHPGGALGPAPAQYKNVAAGAMDIGFGVQGYTPGRFPLTEGLELPFLWDSAEKATRALQGLYHAVPAVQKEYADAKVLALWATGPAQLLTAKKRVETLEDVRGLKIRSAGPMHNKLIEALGAVPLSTPISEAYDALERGVANGAVVPPSVLASFNLADVVGYAAVANVSVATFYLVMNARKWEGLATEDRRLLDELANEPLAMRAAKITDQTDVEGAEFGRQRGVAFHQLSADELGRWKTAAAGIPDQWIRDTEGKGLPGKQIYDQLLQLSQG